MIKDQLTKLKPRDKFVVIKPNTNETQVKIQKQNNKLKSKQYTILKHEIMKLQHKQMLSM